MVDWDTTRYRQHRCGETGTHVVHVCRYCGRRVRFVNPHYAREEPS
jgi:hypothetical protein